jgi:hypothetical protein
MNADVLQTLLVQYNRRAIVLAVALGFCALLFWLLSYALANLLTATFFWLWKLDGAATWIQPAIVAGFMLLLVGELWRKRNGLFNLSELHDSDFYLGPGSQGTMAMGMDHPVTQFVVGTYAAWIVSQTVLLAPHTTSTAFRQWRSRVRIDEPAIGRAVELYRTLAEEKNWVPITNRKQQLELTYLDRAGLLWSRREGKLLEVQTFRYEPPISWWAEWMKFVHSLRG